MKEKTNFLSLLNINFKNVINPFSSILLFQFVLYIVLSLNREIWVDEAYSLTTSSFSISDIFFISLNFEGNPPLYFLLLGIWRMLDSSVFFARLLSIVFTVLATGVFYKILRFFMQKNHALLIIILLIFNPFLIFIADNVRYYTLVFLFCNLVIYFFFKFFLYGTVSTKKLVGFSLISGLAIATQYQTVFLLFALGISLLFVKGWRLFWQYLISMIFPLVVFVFMITYLFQVVDTLSGYKDTQASLSNIYSNIVSWVEYFLGFFHFRWTYSTIFYWLFRIPLLILILNFILAFNVKSMKQIKLFQTTTISLFIIISIFLILLFRIFQQEYLLVWHNMILFPVMLVFISIIFEFGKFKLISYASVSVLLVIQLVSVTNNLKLDFLSANFREVSKYMEAKDIQDKEVFVFPAETALIANYELPQNQIVSIPVEIDFFDIFDHNLWVIQSEEQLLKLFEPHIEQKDTIHLLKKKDFISYYNVNYNTEILYNFIFDQRWEILTDTSFTNLNYIRLTVRE